MDESKSISISMSNEISNGIVYVLINSAMPGLVKIGKTSRESIEPRLTELYSTGVPVPFECVYAARVSDEHKVEKAFHTAFGPYRINSKREFFEIEPEQAIALLELVAVEDVTPEVQREADDIDKEAKSASKKLKSRRPNLDFAEMGIPINSTLKLVSEEDFVTVVGNRQVQYNNGFYSLTAITRRLLNLNYDPRPTTYWEFNGRLLNDIYEETYESF